MFSVVAVDVFFGGWEEKEEGEGRLSFVFGELH